jgi:3-oxoacyl-[acyl-carrier-protein] synthase-1
VLLVEADFAARNRQAQPVGYLEAVAIGQLPPPPAKPGNARGTNHEEPAEPPPVPPVAPLGRAIAETIRRVLPAAEGDRKYSGDLYLDLNGEDWRARAWGHAQVHLTRAIEFDRCRTFVPAESIGDTGAASAAIAVGLALWNFHKDSSESALVISVSDNGAVGVIRLGAPKARALRQ